MEDLKTLLAQSEDYLVSSSEENETDDDELSISHLERRGSDVSLASFNCQMGVNANVSKKRNGEQRLPTRRPDPNIYNRNALLARENRRKKKMYLESIEKELQDARKANRILLKALKRQSKVSKRLEQEKKYFHSLFTNQSEILSLLSAINNCRLPHESVKSPFLSTSNFDYDKIYSCKVDPYTSNSNSSSLNNSPLSNNFDNPSDGSVTIDNQRYSSDFSSSDFTFSDFFTDFEYANGSNLTPSTSLDELWNCNGYYSNIVDDLPIPNISHHKDNARTVYVDHSYVAASVSDLFQTSSQEVGFFSESRSQSSIDFDVGTENNTTGSCLHFVGGSGSGFLSDMSLELEQPNTTSTALE